MSDGSGFANRDEDAESQSVDVILAALPPDLLDGPDGEEVRRRARDLARALQVADRNFAAQGAYLDDDLRRVNEAADRISEYDHDFTLSDADGTAPAWSGAFAFNTYNMLHRLSGRADHESKWDGTTWSNWNKLVHCVPESHEVPAPPSTAVDDPDAFEPVQRVVRRAATLRVVAGGHAFSESASTGGTNDRRVGTLLCLDEYRNWRRLTPQEVAARPVGPKASNGQLVRVQAGIRLRDFNAAMWNEGLALPLCGSTDTQSLGGLVASDLHGTGRRNGFLAEQIMELRTIRADGELMTWTRTPDGFVTDEPTPRRFAKLPVAGALGLLGVVVDLVVELIPAYYLEKRSYFADRRDVESDFAALFDRHDHVNLFYPGGGPHVKTIQVNTLDRTDQKTSPLGFLKQLAGELSDHALSSYAPSFLFGMAERDVRSDPLLKAQNLAGPNVLPSPAGFNRRLYYLHDEVEYAYPFDVATDVIGTTVDLLRDEQLHSILEVRVTPDCAQSLIGPGNCARGRGRAVWLGLATAIGEHSRPRILQFFERFDRATRRFGGRPHLGKQTSKTGADMSELFGLDWQLFQSLRRELDPTGKFLPSGNPYLQKLFA